MVPCAFEEIQARCVVSSRACGAALTTLNNSEKKHLKSMQQPCWHKSKTHQEPIWNYQTTCTKPLPKKLLKTYRKATRKHQKSIQNRPLENVWDSVATLLETRTFYVPCLAPFWTPNGTPKSMNKIYHDLSMCLNDFGDHLFMLLASIEAPQRPPKWDPKGSQHQNINIVDFADI